MPRNTARKRERVSTTASVIQAEDAFDPVAACADLQAERALIGSVLLEPAIYPALAAVVQPGDFYSLDNGMIWWAMEQVGGAIDTHTVARVLHRKGGEHADLMQSRLVDYMADVPAVEHAGVYAQHVVESAARIRIARAADRIRMRALEGGTLQEIADDTTRYLHEACDVRGVSYRSDINALLDEHVQRAAALDAGTRRATVLSGFYTLDRYTGGLPVGEITMLAGAAGMGKTSFMQRLALNVAERHEGRVVIFSVEQTRDEVVRSLISIKSGISKLNLLLRNFGTGDRDKYIASAAALRDLPLYIVGREEYPMLTPGQIRRKLREIDYIRTPNDDSAQNIELVIVDGLWLMEHDEPVEQRDIAILKLLLELIRIAGPDEFDIPLLLVHQYKDIIERRDKRPLLSDLAGGRNVDRTVQNVWGMYSAHFYGENDPNLLTQVYLLKGRNTSGHSRQAVDFQFVNNAYREAEGYVASFGD